MRELDRAEKACGDITDIIEAVESRASKAIGANELRDIFMHAMTAIRQIVIARAKLERAQK